MSSFVVWLVSVPLAVAVAAAAAAVVVVVVFVVVVVVVSSRVGNQNKHHLPAAG